MTDRILGFTGEGYFDIQCNAFLFDMVSVIFCRKNNVFLLYLFFLNFFRENIEGTNILQNQIGQIEEGWYNYEK